MAAFTLYDRIGGRRKLGILVRNFYLTLQAHEILGPIFAQHVEDWPAHYETLTEFWALQTNGPSSYRGRFLQAHVPIRPRPVHLESWLAQWQRSCRLHFAEPEATEMIALAENLARRMRETVIVPN